MRRGNGGGGGAAAAANSDVAPGPNSGLSDEEAFGNFLASLDPEARCPVPMILLCVTPPSTTRTNEAADIILDQHPVRWGDFNPPVAEELAKQVHKLWLHAATLDFTCRAQLLQPLPSPSRC